MMFMINNNIQHFLVRREKLFAMFNEGIAIIPNSRNIIRSLDNYFPFRADNNFYYLTGFDEENAILVLDFNKKQSIIFCLNKNPELEQWEGEKIGFDSAIKNYLFDNVFDIKDFKLQISKIFSAGKFDSLFYSFGIFQDIDNLLIDNIKNLRNASRKNIKIIKKICDINSIIAELRLIKDNYEVEIIKKACIISAKAHRAIMQNIKNMNYEYEVEAKLLEQFVSSGAKTVAYNSIVASGANACTLHYTRNNRQFKKDELILIDAGCEFMNYASDITRTFPINGKFSAVARDVYQLVLEANKKAISAIQVGVPVTFLQDKSLEILVQGLIDLKILNGSVAENIENKSYKPFYMHNIGHWLGLDVHDVGEYYENGNPVTLKNGMCTTIEPGLYFNKNENIPKEFWGIGVRIEDDILLIDNHPMVLTINAPKEIDEIEQIMK